MRSLSSRFGWMLSGVLALFVVATLVDVVESGPLDPSGPPGSTLQRIADVPPSWHQILPADNGPSCSSARFECVLFGTAVLDHETGLVWQRTVAGDATSWGDAVFLCEVFVTGERYGWRLPSHQELRTLVDVSADHLPDGHPFGGVLTASPDTFWTSSVLWTPAHQAFLVNIDTPGALGVDPSTNLHRRWCVRAAGEADVRN
jgi:hypothetical protein